MDNRISATGLKNIDADTIEAHEIKVTDQTIIDETGLQVYDIIHIIFYYHLYFQVTGMYMMKLKV